jgi:hypothetical protein
VKSKTVIRFKQFKDDSFNNKIIENKHYVGCYFPPVIRDTTISNVSCTDMNLDVMFINCVINLSLLECKHKFVFKNCTYYIRVWDHSNSSYVILSSARSK